MNTWQRFSPAFLLSFLWWVSAALIWPVGEFPLNDDWAYARNVYYLVEEGRIHFSDWPAMTLIVQVLWGALFCSLFGFSFTILRLSTLVLGWLGILFFHRCLSLYTPHPRLALWGTLILMFNPFYFCLSYSFMTDVPFAALMILSIFHFTKALESEKLGIHWYLGLIFAVLATLIRQLGLLTPLAFALVFLLQRKAIKAILPAILPLLITGFSLKAYTLWLESIQALPAVFGQPTEVVQRLFSAHFLKEIGWRSGVILFYLGIFYLPFLQIALRRPLHYLSLFFVLLGTGCLAIPAWEYLPTGNIWNDSGLGPMVLKDTYFGENLPLFLNATAWSILKYLGFSGSVFLLYALFRSMHRPKRPAIQYTKPLFPVLILLPYLLYMLVDYNMFDRYHIIPFILVLLIAGSSLKRWVLPLPGALFLLLSAVFSIAGTQSYLSWNQVRWSMLEGLEAKGIPPTEIDGGFEYNGWHQTSSRHPIRREGKSWWFVGDDEYVISGSSLDCYEVVESRPYRRWLPPFSDTLYLSKRLAYATTDTIFCDAEISDNTANRLATNHPALWLDNAAAQDSLFAHTGKKSIRLDASQAFGFTTRFTGISPCDHFLIRVWRKSSLHQGAIVASDFENKFFYLIESNNVLETDVKGWELLELEFTVPENYPVDNMVLYVWQNADEPTWWDGFWIERKSQN